MSPGQAWIDVGFFAQPLSQLLRSGGDVGTGGCDAVIDAVAVPVLPVSFSLQSMSSVLVHLQLLTS